MRYFIRGALALSTVFLVASCATAPPAAQAVLQQAQQAMGGEQLRTLRYAGSGTGSTFGQAWRPGDPWPRIRITSFSRSIDYAAGAMREESARTRDEVHGGGALPLMGQGEQRTSGWLSGEHAWNVAGNAPQASPVALDQRIHDLWTTPHGVLRAAARNAATVQRDGDRLVLSFTEPGRFKASVWIGPQGLVERVDSVHPHPVSGDTPVSTIYSDYRDHGGVKFPGRIRQQQGGHVVLDIAVSEVQPNAPVAIEVPAQVRSFAERVVAEKVADGVWFLAGGSHNSVLIELQDHLVLVESPLYDGRSEAVIAEARRLVPGKPLRFMVNSHHHFDHSGGVRTAVAHGMTLVVHAAAQPFFERTLGQPNSIRPDAMARSGRKPSFLAVDGVRNIGDARRPVEIHTIDDSVHAQSFMMVWLPRERLLIEADAFTPGPAGSPPPATPNGNHLNLVANIERLKLDVDRILPLHGRVVPISELYTAVGRRR